MAAQRRRRTPIAVPADQAVDGVVFTEATHADASSINWAPSANAIRVRYRALLASQVVLEFVRVEPADHPLERLRRPW